MKKIVSYVAFLRMLNVFSGIGFDGNPTSNQTFFCAANS